MDELLKWMKDGRGRQGKLADALGITHGAVSQWRRVPSDRVLAVEAQTGIKREKLRPDLYAKARAA